MTIFWMLRSGVVQTRPSTATFSSSELFASRAIVNVSLPEVPLIVSTGVCVKATSTSASVQAPRPSVPASRMSSLAIDLRPTKLLGLIIV